MIITSAVKIPYRVVEVVIGIRLVYKYTYIVFYLLGDLVVCDIL